MTTLPGILVDAGPCPYLPDRQFHAFQADTAVDAALYRVLLDNRFRRNGETFYAPQCPACQACQPIRVNVSTFQPRRDQRRCLERNADLVVTWHPRGLDDEREILWRRYHAEVHDRIDDESPQRFTLSDANIPGGELHVRDSTHQLLGVAMCDLVGDAWSSVYCYWEPTSKARGLGTYLAIQEIFQAQQRELRWWYPGFWVAGCAKMEYKARFGPAEILREGQWQPY